MPPLRQSFLFATLAMLAWAVAGIGDGALTATGLRNLLWWQIASALFGAATGFSVWRMTGRKWFSAAAGPALILGLEASAWLVARNFHHLLGGATRALVFAAAWILAVAIALAAARALRGLRVFSAVQVVFVLAAVALTLATRDPGERPGRERPDLALIVLDAVQVRALGHLGAPLDPSPRIDALAAEGWTSTAAFSSASTSIPGHAAILYGLDVREHGAPTNEFVLPAGLPDPLAVRLRDRGYTTLGFCHNPLVSQSSGFARGFDVWWNWGDRAWFDLPVAVALLEWPAAYLARRLSDRDPVTLGARVALASAPGPLFTLVQLLYTHEPYVDGDGWATPEKVAELQSMLESGALSNRTSYDVDELAWFIAQYLGSVAYSDRLVGEMIDTLRERAGDRGLVVVITADHGENLAEHGDSAVGKHFGPWSTSLRVPLVVSDTRVRTGGTRSSGLSSHQRVARVLLDAADGHLPLEPEEWSAAVDRALRLDPAFIYSEPWLVLVDDSLKVAIDREDLTAAPLVHRWREDFEDQEALQGPEIVGTYVDELLSIHERMRDAGLFETPAEIDPETLEHLRALGYIE